MQENHGRLGTTKEYQGTYGMAKEYREYTGPQGNLKKYNGNLKKCKESWNIKAYNGI